MKTESDERLGSRGSFRPYSPVSREADLEGWCSLMGGRLGAGAAVIGFITCYVYGIAKYGLLLGIGLGWLPAGLVAWVAALIVAPLGTMLLQHAVLGSRHLSSRIATKLHR
jgi:hypothetical protein